jgi:hypothetical protein
MTMAISRPRTLARGIVAIFLALVLATFTVVTPFLGPDTEIIAPVVAGGVGAVALAGLAMSAFALYDGNPAGARPGYRIAQGGVWLIPAAGLATGSVIWLLSGDVKDMGIAFWGTGIVWLIHLLLIRRHARDMRLSGALGGPAPGAA